MIFVFDICDTLFASNTTFDFIQFVLARRKIKSTWNIFLSRKSPVFYGLALANKILNKDFHKDIAVSYLQGLSRQELDNLASQFYHEYLVPRKNGQVWELLDNVKGTGQVILLSSTIEPIARAIAEKNQVTYKASTLEYSNDVTTGRILHELKGRKHEALPGGKIPYAVVTDNLSDWTLVQRASTRYVVLNTPALKKRWEPLDVQFITLYHD